MNFNFDCPHYGRPQTVTPADRSFGRIHFVMSKTAMGHIGISGSGICCANSECQMPTVTVEARNYQVGTKGAKFDYAKEPLMSIRLIPESYAKPQPEYIPAALVEDYTEACRIRDLSPKAEATVAHRCIRGMIRDFTGVKAKTLHGEIAALKRLVEEDKAPRGISPESVDAMDHVRKIGNIGAHMEADIDIIVPVEKDEAQTSIDLIESLFERGTLLGIKGRCVSMHCKAFQKRKTH